MVPALPQYLWLVICGAFAAFGFGWATGANDVANAFGTSVGAKTITLRQAVLIAAVFEFSGAMLLGRVVTSTIAGGIADPSFFTRQPEVYAYGMVVALAMGFLWQGWASYMGYNVSATHSIIGGIIGFALVFGGGQAVQWATPDPASFPPYKGVVPIVMSWFFSPILTGLAAATIFAVVRSAVLRRKNSHSLAFWVLPPAVFVTLFINIFFVFTKGAAKSLGNSWAPSKAAWVSALIALGASLATAFIVLPLLRRRSNKRHEAVEAAAAAAAATGKDSNTLDINKLESGGSTPGQADRGVPDPDNTKMASCASGRLAQLGKTVSKAALYGTSVDVHQCVEEDELISALHARAEKFDERAEFTFGYLQVFSAICVVFAHGAGEVGFMTGPLAAIYDVYLNGTLSKSLAPPIWCLIIGAVSLVIGLATYGYNVTRTVGVQMAKLSPSRGFAAELATSLVILVASQLGLPTSSSQCITGGIVGVGLMEGFSKGVNWKLFGKQFLSWVATLFVVGLGVAAVFAQGVYSPSKIDGGQVLEYENGLAATTSNILTNFNSSLQAYQPAAAAGALKTLDSAQWAQFNTSVAVTAKSVAAITSVKGDTAIMPEKVLSALQSALSLVQDNSVLTLGQNTVFPGAMVCNGNVTESVVKGVKEACVSPQLVAAAP
jgi:sodium-dependent phosphate transporter